jgi:hypothetical protein
MDGSGAGQQQKKKVISLKAIDATPANFKEYGQVVGASPDGARCGPLDAQLQLNLGTPRSIAQMHLNSISVMNAEVLTFSLIRCTTESIQSPNLQSQCFCMRLMCLNSIVYRINCNFLKFSADVFLMFLEFCWLLFVLAQSYQLCYL